MKENLKLTGIIIGGILLVVPVSLLFVKYITYVGKLMNM